MLSASLLVAALLVAALLSAANARRSGAGQPALLSAGLTMIAAALAVRHGVHHGRIVWHTAAGPSAAWWASMALYIVQIVALPTLAAAILLWRHRWLATGVGLLCLVISLASLSYYGAGFPVGRLDVAATAVASFFVVGWVAIDRYVAIGSQWSVVVLVGFDIAALVASWGIRRTESEWLEVGHGMGVALFIVSIIQFREMRACNNS